MILEISLGILGAGVLLLAGRRLLGLRRCGNCRRWTADPGGFIVGTEDFPCCPRCVQEVVEKIQAKIWAAPRRGQAPREIKVRNDCDETCGTMNPWGDC